MPIPRTIGPFVVEAARQYPVVTITGPRQSGKTTLCRMLFPDKPFISLEDPVKRAWAESDPAAFFRSIPDGAVLDEVQRWPELMSHIQVIVDERKKPGQFILTGSAQFSLMQGITQSLAGRTALITLLPFSIEEVALCNRSVEADFLLFHGFYPRVIAEDLPPTTAYVDYFRTYVERDLRMISQIHNLGQFEKFVRLCAGRAGQLLNLSSLGNDAGVSHTTAREWLTLLETSYIVFLLPPYYRNISKRLVKSPKLYFYDVGLASWLLGIERAEQLAHHPLKGSLFENLVVAELLKHRFNSRRDNNLFFYRDHKGVECDVLYSSSDNVLPIEIKAGETFAGDFVKGIDAVRALLPTPAGGIVAFGGKEQQQRGDVTVTPFQNLIKVLESVEKKL